MKIYFLDCVSESCDRWKVGYWTRPLTKEEQVAVLKKQSPDDFPDDMSGPGKEGSYLYWALESFECLD